MNVLELFKKITVFVFDVDGVLTDGGLLVMPGMPPLRTMNVKDGYALQLAVKRGYKVVVISGGKSPEAAERLAMLGITDIFMQCEDKKAALVAIVEKYRLEKSEVLYMGDDIPDHAVMLLAGLPCCPADAAVEIKEISKYVSPVKGGHGCVRDVIERVLKLRGHWGIDLLIKAQ
jgi:3-deoxy-D-manno-octulosonate 8-phosphate phosphatase (KDO 8-P phosphatase)